MAFLRKNSIIEFQEKHIFHLLFYSFVHSSHFPWKLGKYVLCRVLKYLSYFL